MTFATHGNTTTMIREFGTSVQIPDSLAGHLRYYVDCVCSVLDIEEDFELLQLIPPTPSLAELRNYTSQRKPSLDEMKSLGWFCFVFSPDELSDGKVFIQNDEMCGNTNNNFITLSSLERNIAIADSTVNAGQRQAVKKIMVFKPFGLAKFWVSPMNFFFPDYDKVKLKIERVRLMVPSVICLEPLIKFTPNLTPPQSTCCTLL